METIINKTKSTLSHDKFNSCEDGYSPNKSPDYKTSTQQQPSSLKQYPTPPYRLLSCGDELSRELLSITDCKEVALDVETTGVDPLNHRICLIQLSVRDYPVLIIDIRKMTSEELIPLKRFVSGSMVKIFHNAKFDMKFLKQADLPVSGPLFDTMIVAKLIDSGLNSHGFALKDLARDFLNENLPKDEQKSDWSGPLTQSQLEYAARDAAILLRLRDILKPKLRGAGLIQTALLEFRCLPSIVNMELNGIKLDLVKWDALKQRFIDEKCRLETEVSSYLPGIKPSSHIQLKKGLKSLGIDVESTDKYTLQALSSKHPIIDILLQYKKAEKMCSFIESFPKKLNPTTGRIHSSYNQMGTTTGRFACSDPNLQQIPRDNFIRECFIPEPGYKLIIADYSQIELRVAAELSKDEAMLKAYQSEGDLHKLTASLISGKPQDQLTKDDRSAAKAVNFGLIYAMSTKGLQDYAKNNYKLDLSYKDAAAFRSKFFITYKGLLEWHRTIKYASKREARTIGGRRRTWSKIPPITECYNTPVQGTAADILKEALALLHNRLDEVAGRLVACVHDEILIEVPIDKAERARDLLVESMREAGRKYLKLVIAEPESNIASSWAEKK